MVYDKETDAAYIYIIDTIRKGEVKKTVPMSENVILDYDSHKKLIGIEILSASKIVPKQAVAAMELE